MDFTREFASDCRSGDCGVAFFGGDLGCDSGGGCFAAYLVEGYKSKHHDEIMIKATAAIKAVLDMIPEDPTGAGRNPSFIQTKQGLFLAWVRHEEGSDRKEINKASSEETEKALKLKID